MAKTEDCQSQITTPTVRVIKPHTKTETNYRFPLLAVTTSAPGDALDPLKEIPLLYRHNDELHLVSASSCVKEIIRKKKEAGIKIDDQALAIAYSECDKSNNLKSSFKTCTCKSRQLEMDESEYKEKMKANEDKVKELESKLKSQDEKQKEELESRKAKYSKLFAQTEDEEDGKKMYARLKATTEDKEDLKAMDEEFEKHNTSRKSQTEDPKMKELESRLKAREEKDAVPMVAALVAVRKGKMPEAELTQFEESLKAKSFAVIEDTYNNEAFMINSLKSTTISTPAGYKKFEFNGGESQQALSSKSLEEITEGKN